MFDFLRTRKQRQSAEKNLKIYDSMLSVSDVKCGYEYWRKVLINKIIRLFKYDGLPDTIPGTELEKINMLTGKVGLVPSVYGTIAVPINTYGIGLYKSDLYLPYGVWATPLVSGDGLNGKDFQLIANNSFCRGINETVNRYARMLADVESTLSMTLVNVRQPAIAAAPDESTAASYQASRLALSLGDQESVINASILDDIKTIPAIQTIPGNLLSDIIEARDELLSQFFAEFGVASRQSKKAPMTISEVESDVQVLEISIVDMFQTRKECIEHINRNLGTEITVDISEEFKPIVGHKDRTFNETGDPRTGQEVSAREND